MASVGSLVVELSANVARLQRDMQTAVKSLQTLQTSSERITSAIKNQWSNVSAKIQTAMQLKDVAMRYGEMGAKAMQAEETFRNVAEAYGKSADKIIADLKRVTNATIDDSDMMQKSIKFMGTGEFTSYQLIKIGEAARIAARVTGEDISATFERIADSISTNMPKSLKQMGLITKEQMTLINEAVKLGITDFSLYDMVIANVTLRQAAMGNVTENAAERFQQFKAHAKDTGEMIGKYTVPVVIMLHDGLQKVVGWALEAGAAMLRFASSTASASMAGIPFFGNMMPKGSAEAFTKMADQMDADAKKMEERAERFSKARENAMTGPDQSAVEAAQRNIKNMTDKLRALIETRKAANRGDTEAQAMLQWVKSMEQLNPHLDQTALKVQSIKDEAVKLREKWGDKSWINSGLAKGLAYLGEKARLEFEELVHEINTIGAEGRNRDMLQLEKWFSEKKMKYQSNGEALLKIEESYNQQVADINKKYRWQDLENQQRVFEAEITLRKKLLDLSLDRGMVSELEAKRRSISMDEEAVNSRKKLLEVKLTETKDEEIKKGIRAELIVLEKELLALEQERLRVEQEMTGTFGEGLTEGMRKYLNTMLSSFQTGRQFAIDTAQAMEEAFGTFFFDAMTGQLKSLADYWRSFSQQIMKYISDIIAKMTMMKLFGSFDGEGFSGGLFSSLLGGLMGMAQGGIMNSGGAVSLRRYAGGGIANQPQLAMFGEGTMPEAYVPLPDGRSIPVTMNGNQGTTIVNHWNISAMDAQSFSAFAMQNQNTFAGAIMSASSRNHPIRRSR